MSLTPKSNKLQEDWVDKTTKIPMEDQMQRMMKKGRQPAEDNRFAGETINKARQQQRRAYVLGHIMQRAKAKKDMGMSLFPEEQWVLSNRSLFL
jgi:hypothetical protein